MSDPAPTCRAFVRSTHAKRTGSAQCKRAAEKSGLCGPHEKALMRREQAVLTQYKVLGKQLQVSPLSALLSLIYEAAGNVQFYRGKVEAMERLISVDEHGREQMKALVGLYNEERDRLEKYTLDGLRINLEARQVQLYEMQAHAIDSMARAMIEGLNLKAAERTRAAQIMAGELRKFADSQKDDRQWQGPFLAADRIEFDDVDIIDTEAQEVG